MTAADFFAASNVLIVAGKGGVGKTTVGATIGIAAAKTGCDVLLIELEGYSNLSSLFDLDGLGYQEVDVCAGDLTLEGRLRARQVKPDAALADYLDRAGLSPITGRLSRSGAIEVVATAAPGIRDLLALGKIRQIEQASSADLIVVDAPAAGHALTFLTAAAGLASSTSTGPVREQADQVLEMFGDEKRCQVMLVTIPEETPVSEAIETGYSLEEDVGIKLAPLVINGVWPEVEGLEAALAKLKPRAKNRKQLETAARYRLRRVATQQSEMERLSNELPLRQLTLPYLFETSLRVPEIANLADVLIGQVER